MLYRNINFVQVFERRIVWARQRQRRITVAAVHAAAKLQKNNTSRARRPAAIRTATNTGSRSKKCSIARLAMNTLCLIRPPIIPPAAERRKKQCKIKGACYAIARCKKSKTDTPVWAYKGIWIKARPIRKGRKKNRGRNNKQNAKQKRWNKVPHPLIP